MVKDYKAGQPKVAVIILNYRVWSETLRCVASVRRSTYKNLAILVIDNHSPDDSARQLKKRLPAGVTFLANARNTGYAGGNNWGLQWALKQGAGYAFILNPDTLMTPRAIERLVQFAQSPQGQNVGLIGPLILHPDRTIYSAGGDINWTLTKATLRHNGVPARRVKLAAKPFECGYITGTALLVSTKVLQVIGFMREDYFLYYEDSDWSWRCRRAGYKQMVVPEAVVYHAGYQSTGLLSESYIYYHTRNGLYLALWNGLFLIRVLAIAISVIKLLKQPIKYVLAPAKRHWIKPVSRGILDAWRGITGPYQP